MRDVCSREDAAVALSRITPLLAGIVTRTTYLELLSGISRRAETPDYALPLRPMIAEATGALSVDLDETARPRHALSADGYTDAYRDELRQYLLRVPEEDEEQQRWEALRQFKQAQLLRMRRRILPVTRCR